VKVCVLVWNGFTHDARVRREARSLAARGARVRIVCICTPSRSVESETEDGVEVIRVRTESWLSRRLERGLGSVLQELRGSTGMLREVLTFSPDIVHGNDVNTLLPAWLGARLCGAGLVYDAHEISADREGYRRRAWLVRLLERTFGKRADARITTTRMRADWFEENYGFKDVYVVQNRPEYSAVTSNLIRERLPIPPGDLVVLYQGGLQAGRGLRNLIRAVQPLDGVQLVFVGDGTQRNELEALAEGHRDRIHFVGQVPLAELPLWTASADVGVQVLRNTCLNHYTTDSNKLFEYVMGGLPVIASDFPEIRAIVDTHQIGLLVNPEDVVEVRGAIEKFAGNAAFRSGCARNSCSARCALDWASQEPSLLAAHHDALGKVAPLD
jgi:glycosyltransferase involved in cell wall biosynthesis